MKACVPLFATLLTVSTFIITSNVRAQDFVDEPDSSDGFAGAVTTKFETILEDHQEVCNADDPFVAFKKLPAASKIIKFITLPANKKFEKFFFDLGTRDLPDLIDNSIDEALNDSCAPSDDSPPFDDDEGEDE